MVGAWRGLHTPSARPWAAAAPACRPALRSRSLLLHAWLLAATDEEAHGGGLAHRGTLLEQHSLHTVQQGSLGHRTARRASTCVCRQQVRRNSCGGSPQSPPHLCRVVDGATRRRQLAGRAPDDERLLLRPWRRLQPLHAGPCGCGRQYTPPACEPQHGAACPSGRSGRPHPTHLWPARWRARWRRPAR